MPIVVDDFNAVDSSTLGNQQAGQWVERAANTPGDTWTNVSNTARTSGTGVNVSAICGATAGASIMYAQIVLGSTGQPAITWLAGIMARCSPSAMTGYLLRVAKGASPTLSVQRVVNGGQSAVGNTVPITLIDDGVLRIEVTGGESDNPVITGYYNGSLLITQTDTNVAAIKTGTLGGIFGGIKAGVIIDSFEAGPLVSGPLRWPWQQRRHRRMRGAR